MTVSQFLPQWVGWLGPAVVLGFSLVVLLILPGLGLALIRRRLVPGLHWTKRAELATEARTTLMMGGLLVPIIAYAWVTYFNGPFSRVPDPLLLAAIALVSFTVVATMAWWFMGGPLRQPLPGLRRYYWLVARKWWPVAALVLIAAIAPGAIFSPWMIPWSALAGAALYALRYLAEIWSWAGVAWPADERVVAAVAAAAARTEVAAPRTVILDTHAANALALPVRNLIIMTKRLVDELDDSELEAVALHEIAHLNERPSVTLRRELGLLTFLPLLAIKPLAGAGAVAVIAAFAVGIGTRLYLRGMDAAEEGRADEEAIELSHHSEALGSGLLKMHEAALIPAYVRRAPHGPLHDRLVQSGITPDFAPIVSSPRMRRLTASMVLALVVALAAVVAPWFAFDIWDGDTGSDMAVAFGWRAEEVLWWQGLLATQDAEYATAAVYMEEGAALGSLDAVRDLPWVLASAGRCEEVPAARDALVDAAGESYDIELANEWVRFCEEQLIDR
jgi:Zn-dependent protease with chaperone function